MNVPATDPNLEAIAAAEAAADRWRDLAVRALSVLGLGTKEQILTLKEGWICFGCGLHRRNPLPDVCPRCGAMSIADDLGPTLGRNAPKKALQLLTQGFRAPQDEAPAADGPEGRQTVEVVVFCTNCRSQVPAEVTRPEDCPRCHGEPL